MANKENTVSRSAVADLRKRRRETAALVGLETPTGRVRRGDRAGRLSVRTFEQGKVMVTHNTAADLVGFVAPTFADRWTSCVVGAGEGVVSDDRAAALAVLAEGLAALERFGELSPEERSLILNA